MWAKTVVVVCIQAVLLKAVLSQCIGPRMITGGALWPFNVAPNTLAPITPVIGRSVTGNLIVDTSATEGGITIFSDDIVFIGDVLVTGNLPFLGTVALDGKLPAAGTGATTFESGTGNIGIVDRIPVSNIPANVPGVGLAGGINRFGRF